MRSATEIVRICLIILKSFCESEENLVPVIAILTKFDDFMIQVAGKVKRHEREGKALKELGEKFEIPLKGFQFPPKAMLHLKGILLMYQCE